MKAARQEAGLIWQLNLSGKDKNEGKCREDNEVLEAKEVDGGTGVCEYRRIEREIESEQNMCIEQTDIKNER